MAGEKECRKPALTKTLTYIKCPGEPREASWSAPALWRYEKG